ncbi:type II toxin-antitoxin system PemK/MazF family toxin [Guyparkeria halophila]|uniref:Type II toxin-antitoxin system PemK/MazF family toxin n=1 Tax=Guyparkeria halophila TaxID=47960 RepID=A0A6I6CZ57_9GAMM|nr:type II toxin-antitoxin system PemK/MazF family toxin [Guyparkeria halophila]QGT77928.1 type II toxin-antitoxin system PemK/MazF family toxin [Guyparkeria halophila]
MSLKFHPEEGAIVICDFSGFKKPEMIKRRPVVVVSPRFRSRSGLCTIVPLSTTKPLNRMPYHHVLHLDPPLPPPFDSVVNWVKADLLATVSFERLKMPFDGKDEEGRRRLVKRCVSTEDLDEIRECIKCVVGINRP